MVRGGQPLGRRVEVREVIPSRVVLLVLKKRSWVGFENLFVDLMLDLSFKFLKCHPHTKQQHKTTTTQKKPQQHKKTTTTTQKTHNKPCRKKQQVVKKSSSHQKKPKKTQKKGFSRGQTKSGGFVWYLKRTVSLALCPLWFFVCLTKFCLILCGVFFPVSEDFDLLLGRNEKLWEFYMWVFLLVTKIKILFHMGGI